MLILFINSSACRLKITHLYPATNSHIAVCKQNISTTNYIHIIEAILCFVPSVSISKYIMSCVAVPFIDCCGREWWVKIDLILAATKSPSAVAVATPAKEVSKEGPDTEDQSSWSRRDQQRMNWIGLNDPWGAECQYLPNFCAPAPLCRHSLHFSAFLIQLVRPQEN